MSEGWQLVMHRRQARRDRRRRAYVVGGAVPLALLAVLSLAACAAAVSGWQPVGDSGLANAPCLAADPFAGTIVYVCARHGQVYRSRADKGSAAVGGQGLPGDATVLALVPDARTPGLLYAGTTAGFFVSRDHGDTWQAHGAGLPQGDPIDAVIAVPAEAPNQAAVYAGTPDHGVYVTHDAGTSWMPASDGLPHAANVDALFWDHASRTLFVSLDQGGVFAVASGARTWEARGTGLTQPALCLTALATGGDSTLFAGTSGGLFSSGDGGRHWSAVAGAPRGQVAALAPDPAHPTLLYAGIGSAVYRSEDAGRSWVPVASPLRQSVAAVLPVDLTNTTVVYAAADVVYRDPPFVPPPASPLTPVLSLLALAGAVVAAAWALVRMRRQIGPLLQRTGPAAQTPREVGQHAADNSAALEANGYDDAHAGSLESATGDELPPTNGHRRVPR